MGEDLEKLRQWAKGRTVPASNERPETIKISKDESNRPRLKQEQSNPFIV